MRLDSSVSMPRLITVFEHGLPLDCRMAVDLARQTTTDVEEDDNEEEGRGPTIVPHAALHQWDTPPHLLRQDSGPVLQLEVCHLRKWLAKLGSVACHGYVSRTQGPALADC